MGNQSVYSKDSPSKPGRVTPEPATGNCSYLDMSFFYFRWSMKRGPRHMKVACVIALKGAGR